LESGLAADYLDVTRMINSWQELKSSTTSSPAYKLLRQLMAGIFLQTMAGIQV